MFLRWTSRASVYYRSVPTRAEDLELMALMDRGQYSKTPCLTAARKMKAWTAQQGYLVSRKRVRRLMRLHGSGSHLPASGHCSKPARDTGSFPVSAEGSGGSIGSTRSGQRGQSPTSPCEGFPVPGGHVMDWHPSRQRAGLEALQHHGHQLLRGGVGRRALGKGRHR